jgi:hypothetical protein
MAATLQLAVIKLTHIRLQTFENDAARMRIECPMHHQDGDFNRRKCRWVNPFCLQAQHVIPCLPLRPRVDFLFFIRTSRAAERTSDRLF